MHNLVFVTTIRILTYDVTYSAAQSPQEPTYAQPPLNRH